MARVILARESDSDGWVRLLLADPIGRTQAGDEVLAELAGGGSFAIVLHGIREFDVPASVKRVVFSDGSEWKP